MRSFQESSKTIIGHIFIEMKFIEQIVEQLSLHGIKIIVRLLSRWQWMKTEEEWNNVEKTKTNW